MKSSDQCLKVSELLKLGSRLISKSGISEARQEARILFCSASNLEQEVLTAYPELIVKDETATLFMEYIERRCKHEPVSKIIGKRSFWKLDLSVNSHVLDPRPESEFLIQTIKKFFTNTQINIKICDLGTGSGCLAITLAKLYKNSKILATEISQSAFKVAKKNIILHNVKNQIELINCNWISDQNFFDVIITNPPYLSKVEYDNCEENVKQFEPKTSLLGGIDGLDCYRQISAILNSIINENSFVFIEIGRFQKNKIKNIFNKNDLKLIKIIKDYQKIDRVLVFKKKKYEKNKKKLA